MMNPYIKMMMSSAVASTPDLSDVDFDQAVTLLEDLPVAQIEKVRERKVV